MKYLLTTILVAIGLMMQPAFAKKQPAEKAFSQEQLQAYALARLAEMDHAVALYVKGMICKSCGIGIRKKVGSLDFVDTGRFEKGVEMDIDHMLLFVGIHEDADPDADQLGEAIRKAGYSPVSMYRVSEGAIIRSDIN